MIMDAKIGRKWAVLILLTLPLFVGCAATVPIMPDDLDASAEQFAPPADKANLYITRISDMGMAVLFQVRLDGELVGSIATDTYLLFEVEPGQHKVSVITPESQALHRVDAQPGNNYFVDVVPKMGWAAARAELVQLTDEEGRKAVVEAARAEPLVEK